MKGKFIFGDSERIFGDERSFEQRKRTEQKKKEGRIKDFNPGTGCCGWSAVAADVQVLSENMKGSEKCPRVPAKMKFQNSDFSTFSSTVIAKTSRPTHNGAERHGTVSRRDCMR